MGRKRGWGWLARRWGEGERDESRNTKIEIRGRDGENLVCFFNTEGTEDAEKKRRREGEKQRKANSLR